MLLFDWIASGSREPNLLLAYDYEDVVGVVLFFGVPLLIILIRFCIDLWRCDL